MGSGGGPSCSQCGLTPSHSASISILSAVGIARPDSHLCAVWTVMLRLERYFKLKRRAKTLSPLMFFALFLRANLKRAEKSDFSLAVGITEILQYAESPLVNF